MMLLFWFKGLVDTLIGRITKGNSIKNINNNIYLKIPISYFDQISIAKEFGRMP